jgi:rhamnosyltransferase
VSPARSESQLEPLPGAGTHTHVCAVVVTHNPDSSFEQNIRALLPQVGKLIIVDNQSASAGHSLIARTAAALKVEVIWNQENLGIARGLNAGVERAVSSGQYSWVATFDQDSLVPAGYVEAIFQAYSACPFRDQVAVIGPTYSNPIHEYSRQSLSNRNDFKFREIKSTMTSGSFLKSSVPGICGRFDESLFMDYVDHEFCLRLRKHGFKIMQAGNAVLEHRLGSPSLHRFLWKRFSSSNHSSSRRYYNARNRVIVYRRYLMGEGSWVLSDVFGWLREMVKVALVERNRTAKLVSVTRGIWDAMKDGDGGKKVGR